MSTAPTFLSPLLERLHEGEVELSLYSLSTLAWTAAKLHEQDARNWVLVCDGPRTLDALYQDLQSLTNDDPALLYFPGWEALPGEHSAYNQDLAGDRLNTLRACQGDAQHIIVTSVQALMQHTIHPDELNQALREIKCGEDADLEELSLHLEAAGYDFVPEVEAKGEVTRRGGLLDIWSPDQILPLRIEWFGDEVESIRQFDPADQRSVGKVDSITITPVRDRFHMDSAESKHARLLDYLPNTAGWMFYEPADIDTHAEVYLRSLDEADSSAYITAWAELKQLIKKRKQAPRIFCGMAMSDKAVSLPIESIEAVSANTEELIGHTRIDQERKALVKKYCTPAGHQAQIFFHTEGALKRFQEQYFPKKIPKRIQLHAFPVSDGFAIPGDHTYVLTESDIYGIRKAVRGKYDPHNRRMKGPAHVGQRIADWTDIEPGQLVVHTDHGIGKYMGLYETTFNGSKQEALVIEYGGDGKLYLPVSQAHLLSRYIGVGKTQPKLHKLGGSRWTTDKLRAQRAVVDLAANMLETQAARDTMPGHAYACDTEWQQVFEATFPYTETADQEAAINAVKEEMERTTPMDHLVCGDVGYGKTEVAMRAAFKAVMDGKQVAMLVPTTLLARQHYQAFKERMAAFPVTIEMLSRFRTKSQQRDILEKLEEGSIDIVIGTHRLVQGDLAFADLGLVIIDEEQRFGVGAKEKLKDLSKLVDVITLTATPIPRTLYMSLTGARNMSVISTPPKARLPINTIVQGYSDEIVRKAILMEINREGQVFFLHNRVRSIANFHDKISRLVPEARIEFAHGQMPERELERLIIRFINQDFDVLLCTTIIESGIDIPNVNTIIIDRADRFGMADLYQLRGRVGRDKHQAYAYLLLPERGRVDHTARQRVSALQKYSSLGAGFKLALRDLETRGAGNLLGSEQSGHITAVGFDLYCQLLDRTVKQMKNQVVPPLIDSEIKIDFVDLAPDSSEEENAAVLPIDFVEDEALRIDIYRKLAAVADMPGLQALYKELQDRFGRLPHAVKNLLRLSEIRIASALEGITEVQTRAGKVMLKKNDSYLMVEKRFPVLRAESCEERLVEILGFIEALVDDD